MREKFLACVNQNAYGNYDVVMYYQCKDGTFANLFHADNKAGYDAAYLQRKSCYHEAYSLFYDYTVLLYDFNRHAFVQKTNIVEEDSVAISGLSNVTRSVVAKFLCDILSAVDNLDIQGTLYLQFCKPGGSSDYLAVCTTADIDALL